MMKALRISSLFCLIALNMIPIPSWARGEVEQLQTDVSQLKASVENANLKLAEAMNQLTSIQQQFAGMQGLVESGGHFYDEQRKAFQDYDQRISALEDKITLLTQLFRDIKEGRLSEKAAAVSEAETHELQRLLDFVSAEDYNKALPGLQAFLQKNPKGPLADLAQYWIADSHYGLRDYKRAIADYQTLIQKYPQSSKVKAAVLKQGLSFYGLKMYPEALPFFEKVIATYPNTSEAARASGKLKEMDRLLAASSAPPSGPGKPTPTTQPAPSLPLQTITKPFPASVPSKPPGTPPPPAPQSPY
jgi:tol-pal system protein YbgF